jgi:site-specific DNA-methyltransferase (adenine-specific)
VRFGVWIKTNGAPQFTGDRPAPGWEGIAFLHREGGRMEWNGGGRSSVFITPKVNTAHPTGKPEQLIREFVRLFSQPDDLVLDPFMGSGTTLRAAKDLGRRAIGIEIEERYCAIAVERLRQQVLPLEGVS